MKKVIVAAIVAGLVPMLTFAQGTVNFGTTAASHKVVVGTVDGAAAGPGFSAALYWGAIGSTEAQLVQLGAITTVTGGTGFLVAGGTRTTGAGTAPGANGLFQVRAWDGAFTSFETAFAAGSGFLGKTEIFTNPTGNPGGEPPTTPAFLTGWTTPLVVTVVPEPSTIALAGLGLAGLLLFRRRK